MMDRELLPVKSQFVFNFIFGTRSNADILIDFLKSVLDFTDDEFGSIEIIEHSAVNELKTDTYGAIDVKINTKSGSVIQAEIQIEDVFDMKNRVLYSQSKMVTEQIKSGNGLEAVDKVISILITDYLFIRHSEKYHRRFRYRTEDGVEFTNPAEINTLELEKLPKETDNSELWYRMKFIKAEKTEDLNMLAERCPRLRKAVEALRELSADEQIRMVYENKEKARREIADKMKLARTNGEAKCRIEVAGNLLKMGMDNETIMQATGLTNDEINSL
jgi:predicted transposase/invertase (TIGR01784 family)